ncbi:hypothetical protein [Companilactobacillus kimchii]|uniref:Uncharacterized protein n=2 Tax=Companilactobacillus kimchii TaxID=2801452 RepID=A0ABR5NQR2_9LACO|nr:hypothetical protein [Companilactobacillus kimchii]KAE9562924.1 hypothetical protein ATN91_01820 [Companilactobacillus kimchii]KRK49962.1 hypothetical protein FC97_GL002348 [Companilactobacillus kimchii DSM 13961 = JCM 10707]OWF31916.1 hypothetical protein LKACC12383_02529 [Companilactobacillus kimchii]GEO48362.1 hypothetical protein LKI01_23610 [Companilactobacillus paralimentarius]
MKIAIQLDSDRNIIGIYSSPESGAERQSEIEGWTLVDSDPAFSIDESSNWTVRESDNKLVHISTGLTPDEEAKALLVTLTKSQLKDQLMNDQIQQAVTSVTKQAIQDKLTSQMAITELTKKVADLTIKLDKANGVDPAPEAPTDVTSTATNDGAVITAK